ncbi:MAG: hypothetical protein AMXMBFR7_26710 [Planctomycetota bacterium]
MGESILLPDEVDALCRWTPGRAEKLARRGKIPHFVLPDGSIRFDRADVAAFIRRVDPEQGDRA